MVVVSDENATSCHRMRKAAAVNGVNIAHKINVTELVEAVQEPSALARVCGVWKIA